MLGVNDGSIMCVSVCVYGVRSSGCVWRCLSLEG